MEKINLEEKLSLFVSLGPQDRRRVERPARGADHRRQTYACRQRRRTAGANLVKLQGGFVWHKHDAEDELFLLLHGEFDMEFRDRVVRLREGEFLIVPRGVEHRPVALREAHVLLFEPVSTVNTGDAGGPRTVARPERI